MVCHRSVNYVKKNCNCAYYKEVNWVDPYCFEWIESNPLFCFLSGGSEGKFCPDAVKYEEGDIYWTKNKAICEKVLALLKCIVTVIIMNRLIG